MAYLLFIFGPDGYWSSKMKFHCTGLLGPKHKPKPSTQVLTTTLLQLIIVIVVTIVMQ